MHACIFDVPEGAKVDLIMDIYHDHIGYSCTKNRIRWGSWTLRVML